MTLLLRVFSAPLLAALAFALTCAPACAAGPVYVVNSTDDVPASAPLDDGRCETSPGNGICTLRAAVMKANHGAPNAMIRFGLPGVVVHRLTISRWVGSDETVGDLNIDQPMTIAGNGPQRTIIEGAPSLFDRIFHVKSGATLSGLTIRNGRGLVEGGAVRNVGSLVLRNCVVSDSTAVSDSNGGSAFGGAIFNRGSLNVDNCTIARNVAAAAPYGFAWGGGVFSEYNGYAMFRNSTIADNRTTGGDGRGGDTRGGGIWGAVNAVGSTISGNRSSKGGGIVGYGSAYPDSNPTLVNTTISGNVADGDGGGLLVFGGFALVNVTVTNNRANASADDGADSGGSGGGINASAAGANLSIKHSLIAGNVTRKTTGGSVQSVDDDCVGKLVSNSTNRIGAASPLCQSAGPLTFGKPDLGPLGDYGGLTQTHPLARERRHHPASVPIRTLRRGADGRARRNPGQADLRANQVVPRCQPSVA